MGDETSNVSTSTSAAVDSNGYIQTAVTNNYISRTATLEDSKCVEMKGRSIIYPEVLLRNSIRIGRYCHIQASTILQPPLPKSLPETTVQTENGTHSTTQRSKSMTIGSHTMIGQNCMIEAAAIGSNCFIGDYVRIGTNVTIKDNCIIASYTEIPPNTNIPPFTRCYTTNSSHASSRSPCKSVGDRENVIENTEAGESNGTVGPLLDKSRRRNTRLITTSLPPAIVAELQERAVASFHAFVTELRRNEVGSK